MEDHESVSLREYLTTKMDNIEKAVGLAHASMEKRLEGMNEFRNALRDQERKYLTKDTFDLLHKQVDDMRVANQKFINRDTHDLLQRQVDELRLNKANLEGKASQSAVNIATVMAAIGVLLAVINFILKFYNSTSIN